MKLRMIIRALLICLSMGGQVVMGQQANLLSNYDLFSSMQNPAYNGLNRRMQLDAVSRIQWSGIPGSPLYSAVSFQSPFHKSFATGANFQSIEMGRFKKASPLRLNLLSGDIAFHKQISNKLFLSTGLRLGVFSMDMRISQLIADELGDPAQFGNDYNFNAPSIGGGIMLSGEHFYLGASVPHHLITRDILVENINLGYNARRLLSLNLGFDVPINKKLSFKFTSQMKQFMGLSPLWEVNGYLVVPDLIMLGYGIRSNNSNIVLTQLKLNEYFWLIYAYDFGFLLGDQNRFSSTEFGLSYRLNFEKQRVKKRNRFY